MTSRGVLSEGSFSSVDDNVAVTAVRKDRDGESDRC